MTLFGTNRYLFGASENLNRFCTECGVKVFSGLDHIFIPHISPTYLGGLPGAIITSAESSSTGKLHLHGPPNLWHYITSLRPFVKNSFQFRILLNQMLEHQLGDDYLFHSDENLSVRGILLKSDHISREDYNTLLANCEYGSPFVLKNSDGSSFSKKYSSEGALEWDFLFSKNAKRNSHNSDFSPSKKKQKKDLEDFYYSFKNRLNIQLVGEVFEKQGQLETLREVQKYIQPTLADYCLCFVCKTIDIPGKFDAEKAAELGVFGALRGKLVKGESVEVNGRVIKPEDLVSPPTPGSYVLIINCPNEHYLKSLLSNKQFEKYFSQAVSVVHCVPHKILSQPVYQKWMSNFNSGCDHVIVNEDSTKSASCFVSSCVNIVEFSLVDRELFTLCLSPNQKDNAEENKKQILELSSSNNMQTVYGESLLKYGLIPTRNRGFDRQKVNYIREIDTSLVENNFYTTYPSIAKNLKEFLEKVSNESDSQINESHPQASILQQCGDEEFEIIFLGTGSSLPSKYRNGKYFL